LFKSLISNKKFSSFKNDVVQLPPSKWCVIVDFYKPLDHMVLAVHNIYVIVLHLRSIEGLVILWDIQNINFQEDAMKYMNLQKKIESPKEKSCMNPQLSKRKYNAIKHIQNTSSTNRKQ
jgi:hypothetical protein